MKSKTEHEVLRQSVPIEPDVTFRVYIYQTVHNAQSIVYLALITNDNDYIG